MSQLTTKEIKRKLLGFRFHHSFYYRSFVAGSKATFLSGWVKIPLCGTIPSSNSSRFCALKANILKGMNPLIARHDFRVRIGCPLLQRGVVGFIIMIADCDPIFIHKWRLAGRAPAQTAVENRSHKDRARSVPGLIARLLLILTHVDGRLGPSSFLST